MDHESYAAGYRQAVCDLCPVEVPKEPAGMMGIWVAYLLGVLVAYAILKFSGE